MGESITDEYKKIFDGKYGCYLDHPQNENDKILAGLCYIIGWIISLVALLAIKPLSPYLRFHAIQALGLHIAYMVFASIASVLMIALIGFCLLPFALALYVYALIIGVLVLTGKDHRVPWLADYVEENYM